jgi:flagellar FliJ protein
MRFRYPLQKIVDLKGSEKSMAEWEYAASLGHLRNEEEKMRQLLEERRSVEDQLAAAASNPVPLAELTSLQQYLDVMAARIRDQAGRIKSAEDQVRLKREGLIAKSVDEKVWLNARNKAYEAFRYEWMVKQQNELDEIAMVRSSALRA